MASLNRETPKKVAWLLLPTFTLVSIFILWIVSLLNPEAIWYFSEALYPEIWIPSIIGIMLLLFAFIFTLFGIVATLYISVKWGSVLMALAGILWGLLFYVCLIMAFFWF